MDYRPISPDLSGYAPKSPDLSALSGFDAYGQPQQHNLPLHQQHSRSPYGGPAANGFDPTSTPLGLPLHQQFLQPSYPQQQFDPHYQQPQPHFGLPIKHEDQDFAPTTPQARPRRGRPPGSNNPPPAMTPVPQKSDYPDPSLGVELKTSFPVARIKRIMQADEDIGKVAQVTPQVVSRALELFMIKLISASAAQAQGNANGGGAKAQKRVVSQHLKQVVMTDDNFDFLREIVSKVPDAPVKAKKDANSDSEESKPAKKKVKKRKDSGDEF